MSDTQDPGNIQGAEIGIGATADRVRLAFFDVGLELHFGPGQAEEIARAILDAAKQARALAEHVVTQPNVPAAKA